MPPPHPLRRISTGSLSSLARSQDRQHASAAGLDFLQIPLTDLSDEATTLAVNLGKLNELHDALGTFNESFAAYLYALKMNAFCVEWPNAPDNNSFARADTLKGEYQLWSVTTPEPPAAAISTNRPPTPPSAPSSSLHPADQTYATAISYDEPPRKPILKKPAGAAGAGSAAGTKKAAMTMKRKRELEIGTVIDTLPLEYRGNQPAARLTMEKVIGRLMDAPDGLPIKAMIFPPDLPQPKVNKCLIALVTKKVVVKNNVGGTTWYKWVGL